MKNRIRLSATFLLGVVVVSSTSEFATAQSRFNFFNRKSTNERPTVGQQRREAVTQQADAAQERKTESDGMVRLLYQNSKWQKVLQNLAESTGSVLIADRFPGRTFTRHDLRKYSRSDAVRILNQALAQHEFMLKEQGKYLLLLHLPTIRPDYRRPIMVPDAQQASHQIPPRVEQVQQAGHRPNDRHPTQVETIDSPQMREARRQHYLERQQIAKEQSPFYEGQRQSPPREFQPYKGQPIPAQARTQTESFTQTKQFGDQQSFGQGSYRSGKNQAGRTPYLNSRPLANQSSQRTLSNSGRRFGPIRQTNFFDEERAKAQDDSGSKPLAQQAKPVPEKEVSKVYKPKAKKAVDLAEILFKAFGDRAEIVEKGKSGLPEIHFFTPKPKEAGDPPRRTLFVLGVDGKGNQLTVQGLESQVGRVGRLLQRMDTIPSKDGSTTQVVGTEKNAAKIAGELAPAVNKAAAANQQPGPPPNPEDPNVKTDRTDDKGEALPDLIGQVRAPVQVEAMEDLGALILTGSQRDVDAVMAIINQIEEVSARTAPDIHLRLLEHVNSEALAELLTTVYTNLNTARGRTVQQTPPISIIAVGRPNAVLVLSSPVDLEAVNALIDELDKPIHPNTNFMVFSLKHTIAAQVEVMLEEFYQDRGGLDTRATIVTDVRTNSIVVLARPNDLREIARLIPELDKPESGAVNEVKVFELKHSAATELADSLNTILQSALNPPTLGQNQLGQAFLGFGGGNSSQQLRDVRSVVLEFLVGEGEAAYKVRSGILADIRINGDVRSNTLIVTAPTESIGLVTELVRRLDRPTSAVATIKHFNLKMADANSVATLLNDLFGNQTTQNNTQVGVQLAGAENASSIVPLRFSVDVRTNSIVAVGTEEALGVVEALIFRLDATDIRNRETTIIRLKNAPAENIADAINEFLQSQTDLLQSQQDLISAFELVEREVIVQAEPYTNSLLISATKRYFEPIKQIVMKLDAALPQVVIQVMLVEVTLDNTDEFGIELGFQDQTLFDRSLTTSDDLTTLTRTVSDPASGIQTTTQDIISQAAQPGLLFNTPIIGNNIAAHPSRVASQGLSSFGLGRTNADLGFGGLVVSAGSDTVNVLLRALSSKREIEVLSRPQIRTLDNQPALIRIGQEVPRVNGFAQNGIQGFVPTVEPAEAGIILQVTPTISPDGNIRITVTAEKSNFDTDNGVVLISDPVNGPIISPIKNITQAETTVVVQDEQTIVLGGLITKERNDVRRAVPWLADIPVLGEAFQFNSSTTRRTELLMFLTPRVVKGPSFDEMLKQIEADRLHYTESDAEEIHGPLFGVPAESYQGGDFGAGSQSDPVYPVVPAPGTGGESPQAPLPLPAEDNSIPMTRVPANSPLRRVNYPAGNQQTSRAFRNTRGSSRVTVADAQSPTSPRGSSQSTLSRFSPSSQIRQRSSRSGAIRQVEYQKPVNQSNRAKPKYSARQVYPENSSGTVGRATLENPNQVFNVAPQTTQRRSSYRAAR